MRIEDGHCHWHGCTDIALRALPEVVLKPVGSSVERILKRVPLCEPHLAEAERTGRINLAYHPDEAVIS